MNRLVQTGSPRTQSGGRHQNDGACDPRCLLGEDITKHINECENKWKKGCYDSALLADTRFKYGEYLEVLPEIRRDMGSPVMKEEAFETAKAILER